MIFSLTYAFRLTVSISWSLGAVNWAGVVDYPVWGWWLFPSANISCFIKLHFLLFLYCHVCLLFWWVSLCPTWFCFGLSHTSGHMPDLWLSCCFPLCLHSGLCLHSALWAVTVVFSCRDLPASPALTVIFVAFLRSLFIFARSHWCSSDVCLVSFTVSVLTHVLNPNLFRRWITPILYSVWMCCTWGKASKSWCKEVKVTW